MSPKSSLILRKINLKVPHITGKNIRVMGLRNSIMIPSKSSMQRPRTTPTNLA